MSDERQKGICFFADDINVLIKAQCWSRVRPRYLASVKCVSVSLQNLYDTVNRDNFLDTVSTTCFEELNCINQVPAHFSKL